MTQVESQIGKKSPQSESKVQKKSQISENKSSPQNIQKEKEKK